MKSLAWKQIGKYLALAYGITWFCWLCESLLLRVLPQLQKGPAVLFVLGGFGPTVAACLCLPGGYSWSKLKKFMGARRKEHFGLALGLAALLAGLAFLLFALTAQDLQAGISLDPKMLVGAFLMWLMASIFWGGNEELGWRGTLHLLLVANIPSWLSPLLVGLVWVFWHLPLWWIPGNVHQGTPFLPFAILGLAFSYWLCAIYDATQSILVCMGFHGFVNTMLGIFVPGENMGFGLGLIGLTLVAILSSAYFVAKDVPRAHA